MSTPHPSGQPFPPGSRHAETDPVGLSWLVTMRWTTLLAVAGSTWAGLTGLRSDVPLGLVSLAAGAVAVSNAWLMWRIRRGTSAATVGAAGALMCGDVVVLTGLLLRMGGVLNPASAFYIVQIVTTALVLGRVWTWIVTGLSVAGYALLYVTPNLELNSAQAMHPEIGLHMRGMWVAFALTAVIVGVLVTRLALAIERRDAALAALREQAARNARVAGLTTLATGAAHELSTPLATIAVAAGELERRLGDDPDQHPAARDVREIRAAIGRCRHILDDMTGQSGGPMGQAPQSTTTRALGDAVTDRLNQAERGRVRQTLADLAVVWPVDVVARAVVNLVRNGLQADSAHGVTLDVSADGDRAVVITVTDSGVGMAPEQLARAGEPFFTTKAAGAGTGLGLFVTQSTVAQLGGTLTLTSLTGRGTTAIVRLPRDVLTGTADAGLDIADGSGRER